MAEHPIMPLMVASLLGDTTHLDNEEFGAYVRILCAMWLNGGCILRADLRKISQLSSYKFDKNFAKISRLLTFVDDTVSQKRLTDIWLKVNDNRRKAAEAARMSWHPLTSKRRLLHPHKQTHMQTQSYSNKKKKEEEGAADDLSRTNGPDVTGTASKRDVASDELLRLTMRAVKQA